MAMTNKGPDPSTVHPLFPELERKYTTTLDAFAGTVGKYVPRLDGQSQSEYSQYLQRSAYYGVVERTASAIVGAMTRKPFTLKGNQEFPDNDYGSADIMLQYLIRDLLLGGRVAMLTDVGDDGKAVIRCYDADDIINWSDEYVVIKEATLEKDPENKFNQIEVIRFRELYLDEDGIYRVNLWSEDRNKKWFPEAQPEMMIKGKLLDYIPMEVCTPYDNTWDVYNPPLFVQAALNIEHFKRAIDLGHYAHYMAIPTFTIIGDLASYEAEEYYEGIGASGKTESGRRMVTRQTQFKLGSTESPLHLTLGSSAQFTEVSGASFAMLENSLAAIEERMYVAGTRLLSSRKGVESVEALQVRAGAEGAVLETITNAIETALNNILEICAQINGTGNQSIELNKDFNAGDMDPTRIKVLLEAFSAGALSLDQFITLLVEGEVLAEGSKPEVEKVEEVVNNGVVEKSLFTPENAK